LGGSLEEKSAIEILKGGGSDDRVWTCIIKRVFLEHMTPVWGEVIDNSKNVLVGPPEESFGRGGVWGLEAPEQVFKEDDPGGICGCVFVSGVGKSPL